MKQYIEKIMQGEHLTIEEMELAMLKIMNAEVEPIIASSFLTALRMKGESVSEIVGGAKVLRQKATNIELDEEITLDTCGTGGDGYGTFNISTATAIVVAAGGVSIVKHGNRSVSSKCGCADVLEELGVNINITAKKVKECIEKINIGFLYAPSFHKAMKNVGKVRKDLGMRTIFNILGPLVNPANASYQLVGVFDESLIEIYANVLKELGVKRALIVHGNDGLDEITINGETKVCELNEGLIKHYKIKPEDFGIKSASIESIKGGNKQENANIIKEIFDGKKGAKRDIVLMNAGASFYITNKVSSIKEGIELARNIIDTNKAKAKLEEFIKQTNKETIYLSEIVKNKQKQIEKIRQKHKRPSFIEALKKDGLSIIGEIKKASPSKGLIKADFKVEELAREYENCVEAISVLTEEDYFLGKDEYLKKVSKFKLPTLCKDFIMDKIQIYNAKTLGASAILLIVNILTDEKLNEFIDLAHELELDVLVEVHNKEELERALKTNAKIIGINNRDLKTFKTSIEVTKQLAKHIKGDYIVVSESGILTKEDVKELSSIKLDAILVGENFMRSTNMKKTAKELKEAYNGN